MGNKLEEKLIQINTLAVDSASLLKYVDFTLKGEDDLTHIDGYDEFKEEMPYAMDVIFIHIIQNQMKILQIIDEIGNGDKPDFKIIK